MASASRALPAPALQPCALFTCQAVQQLHYNARELSKVIGIKPFCSALAAELANIQEEFATSDAHQKPGLGTDEAEMLKLLGHLEKLCQVFSLNIPHQCHYSLYVGTKPDT